MRGKRRVGGTRAPSALLSTKRAALILSGEAAKRGIGGPPMNHWPPANATVAIHLALCVVAALTLFLSSCVAPDKTHHIVVSARDQKLVLLEHGQVLAVYPVSTSKFGLGDAGGTYRTPLGQMEVAQKIGDGAPLGAVFKDRRRTGEVIPVNAPGRDPIVTRILWLRGRERQNANAFARTIYIHGTPEERNIGRPASYGCIRMRSADVIKLYDLVGRGAEVTIVDVPLEQAVPGVNIGRMAQYHPGGGLTLPAVP
jgi:lipoprotein-anchoring transpeptidase ErfK/SrfK